MGLYSISKNKEEDKVKINYIYAACMLATVTTISKGI